MAAELVGGALLSAFLQIAFDRLASPQVLDFFRGRKLNEMVLSKLKVKLRSINSVVDDAELKQIEDQAVREWLFEVKDVVHYAEDLLDEIDYELIKCKMEAESETQTCTCKVPNFFNASLSSFNKKIDSRMKQVLGKLEYLAIQKGDLGLREATYSDDGSGSKVSQKLPSTSLVVESVIYGRNNDKEMIFNWLTSKTDNRNQLTILSIVGMGGVGKTTLAQHVYNDPRLEEADFDIKAWVCVSDEFNVLTITRAILEKIIKSKFDGDLEMLHGRLKEELSGKIFFLVLDDVWNEDHEKWEAVQTPLNYGAPGSSILLTTRSEKVASIVRSCKVHQLNQLQEEHCWEVFSKHAFQDNHPLLDDELKEIATKIVEKCKGLPLALKTMGSLLRTKSSIAEWRSVLISKIWDLPKEDCKIVPALFLSYHHLPSHLKRCFAYCALFPKDYEFEKKNLVQLWMAQNFLQCPQQSMNLEEVGEQYFDVLLSRSFFQRSSESGTFVMHDLLNDLAKYVCGDVCFRLGVDKGESIPKTTRYFSIGISDLSSFEVFESSYDATTRLHSFITILHDCESMIWRHKLFSKFKSLRVLSLSQCFNLKNVPDSLGKLINLRLLDLSYTAIKRLPNSTCLLYNLQILKLNCCRNLEELPLNLYKLTNLRHLEFVCSMVRKMPMHLERMKNLQELSLFYVGTSSEFSIQQLGGLNLHGGLSIRELQNIVNPSDALIADFINKTHLEWLELEWNQNHILDDPRKEKEVLENLEPSKHLKNLTIRNYGGTQFPSWLLNVNVVSLCMVNCKYCLVLPPCGVLPFLKELKIKGFDGIVSIGAEFYGSNSSSFSSLERLKFSNMKEWEEWECKAAFPRLQHLSIDECPMLKGLPVQLLHVKNVKIRNCGRLNISGCNTVSNTSLEVLRIYSCPNMNIHMRGCYDFLLTLVIYCSDCLTTFPLDFFPKLCSVRLNQCRNLKMISQEHTQTHLKDLQIYLCPLFESFPNEGLSAPYLAKIVISGLENLKLLPKDMHILLPSLTDLMIRDCPQVEKLLDGGFPPNLKFIDLYGCFKLMASLKGTLAANTCLQLLSVGKMEVESFPDEGFLPPSLTSLWISSCPDLKKLDYKGLSHLSFLEKLVFSFCPNLLYLPEEDLPKSISTFEIKGCPLLKIRCQKPEGEEWGKIAHIKNLKID